MAKRPKVEKPPAPRKKPPKQTVSRKESDNAIAWRFALADLGGKWGWSQLSRSDFERLLEILEQFETQDLATLKRDKKFKQFSTKQICRDAQRRLIEIKRDDFIDELGELRLGEKKWRAWGVAEHDVFYFLWWDPDHTVCGKGGPPRGTRRG